MNPTPREVESSVHQPLAWLAAIAALLAGCGDAPPTDKVSGEITRAALSSNTAMYDAGPAGADVVDIELTSWQDAEMQTPGGPTSRHAEWKAKLRFKEPIACIRAEVDGTNVVEVIADKNEELPLTGHVTAMCWEGKWEVHASTSSDGNFMGPGAWKPMWDRAADLTAGYQVITQGSRGTPKFRGCNFELLSRLAPCVVIGSPEHQALEAAMQERGRQAQEAAAQRQRARAEEQTRQRAEADERARLAAEATKKKAEEQRRERLLAVMKPFQSAAGAIITAEAGSELGTVILEAAIDDEKLTVSGRATDLREMPFKELTYEGSVDERGSFSFQSSLGGSPVVYGAAGDKLGSRSGFTITALDPEGRAKIDSLVDLGKRLGSGPAAELAVETIDAAAAKTREPEFGLEGLSGTVFFRGRANPKIAPLFAGALTANKAYVWRNDEIVSIRLAEPVQARGLYIRGAAASSNLVVTINGLHQATIASIPKAGGALVTFPEGLQILDLRLQAVGAVSARTIGLMK